MTLTACIAFALAGQTFDVLTTRAGLKRGCSEGNPLLRPLASRGRFGAMTGLKTLAIGIPLIPYLCNPSDRRRHDATKLLCLQGALGMLAGAWNISRMRVKPAECDV